MRATVSLLVLSVLAAGSAGAQSQAAAILNAEKNLRQDEDRRYAAMMKGDTLALGRHLADELVYTHSNALVESRADHQTAIATKTTIYESIAPVEIKYRFFGEFAVGTGTVKSKGSLNGTPFDVTLRVTTVHLNRGGRWQLAAWQSTRIP